jgi:CTP:molybdopterin cytidylyltransferase MocA
MAGGGVTPAITAIVLAAGASTRMGRNKLLLEVEGETLVRRAVRAAAGAGLGRVVVVLGHDQARVRAQLDGLPCEMYDRALFPELLAIDDDRGGKQVVLRHRGEAEAVTWPESALHDVDSPDDYDPIAKPR